jgi:hypothetical protein
VSSKGFRIVINHGLELNQTLPTYDISQNEMFQGFSINLIFGKCHKCVKYFSDIEDVSE